MYWVLMLFLMGQDPTSSFNPVVPIEPASWLRSEDYPINALRYEMSGVSKTEIFVGVDGRPQACYVVESSGSPDLDAMTCAAAIRRGKYKPATDGTGKPMHGMARYNAVWRIIGERLGEVPADVTLSASTLPDGRQSARVALKYIVDEAGRIINCAVTESSGSAKLDDLACRAMPQRYTFAPARDKAGKAWQVVRTQSVAFELSR